MVSRSFSACKANSHSIKFHPIIRSLRVAQPTGDTTLRPVTCGCRRKQRRPPLVSWKFFCFCPGKKQLLERAILSAGMKRGIRICDAYRMLS
jgi:hypothetical protein